jgi:hypothetical protein
MNQLPVDEPDPKTHVISPLTLTDRYGAPKLPEKGDLFAKINELAWLLDNTRALRNQLEKRVVDLEREVASLREAASSEETSQLADESGEKTVQQPAKQSGKPAPTKSPEKGK